MRKLELSDIQKTYKNKTVVQNINLSLEHGIYGLLGENGAGKTTLMRMICGILKPTQGRITCDGFPISLLGGRYPNNLR